MKPYIYLHSIDGSPLPFSECQFRIRHLRTIKNGLISQLGGTTILSLLCKDKFDTMSVAHCNPQDKFCRRKGILTALARFLEKYNLSIVCFEFTEHQIHIEVENFQNRNYFWNNMNNSLKYGTVV